MGAAHAAVEAGDAAARDEMCNPAKVRRAEALSWEILKNLLTFSPAGC
jgi:hypothetical protein